MFQVDKDKCIGCGSCVDVCPQQAIAMVDNIATIDGDNCIDCGTCAQNCPEEAIAHVGESQKKSAPNQGKIFPKSNTSGRGIGRGMGRGMGRGLGRGPRGGRGGGRSGGGRK